MNNEDRIKDLASDVQESKKRMRQQIVTLVITLLVGICFMVAIFSHDADAEGQQEKGVCTTYKVVSCTHVGGRASLQHKIIWKSKQGGRITFEQYPRFPGDTQNVNSVTGFSCKK